MKNRLFILPAFVIMLACSQKSLLQEQMEFINDPGNKITQQLSIGEITIQSKYLPGYIYCQNPENEISEIKYLYFHIKFNRKGKEILSKEKHLYLNFDIEQDFSLEKNGSFHQPAICQKIESGIEGMFEYMLAFSQSEDHNSSDNFVLKYQDKMFGMGQVSFVYDQADIQRIPGS